MHKSLIQRLFIFLLSGLPLLVNAQDVPRDWHLLDPAEARVQGISLDRAYSEFLRGKDSRTVVVAVIDGGVDVEHEDLKEVIWKNTDEIAGNGIDDDKNGYVDDVYGWNFIGGKNNNVNQDTYELTREYIRLKPRFEDKSEEDVRKKELEEFAYWEKIREEFQNKRQEAELQYNFYNQLKDNLVRYHELLKLYVNKDTLTLADVQTIESQDSIIQVARQINGQILMMVGEDADFTLIAEELGDAADYFGKQYKYGYNPDFNPRDIVGDDYSDIDEKFYGNADVIGPDADHGTHVAGIIGASRNNNIGMDGIADNVRIMAVRAVPDGDERDKDVANAIRYAVDNGADIINMSFGKGYSSHKEVVDEAIEYAVDKGVLLIHAAGNEGDDNDATNNYPTRFLDDGSDAPLWIEVGASSYGDDETLVASFSNFGLNSVDLFAPGTSIYSTVTGSTYDAFDGTSMAAPVVSGVAALLMSYYPDLSPGQVREIILQSSRKFAELEVIRPGGEDTTTLAEISRTGGLINAYEAVKMAENMQMNNSR